ncbi:MAG: hypothetical protein PWQ97_73 [Tepidanaerobacteraceae bacterium]|nr:hypothetical protein [Tepidanaerobacteraceae bacterium]
MISSYAQTNPTIYGIGSVKMSGPKAAEFGCKKVLIVTDDGVTKAGIVDKVKESLDAAGVRYAVFDKVPQDPPDYIVNEGGEFARSEKVDGIVAVGGGSPMDAAKAINVLINNPLPISQYYASMDYKPGVPIILIPTTAGTGSENTTIAVITDTKNHVKTAVFLNATLAILDPELTVTLDPEYTVMTGMDAFAHAAESLTTGNPNPRSEVLAYDAIKRIVKNLPAAFADGSDIRARSNLMIASNFAGIAFNDALVHLGHAVAHAVGATFHLIHGNVCALALPEVMIYASKVVPDKVKLVGSAMGISFNENETPEETGEKVAAEIRKFIKNLGIKSFSQLGISKNELVDLADKVTNDACFNYIPKKLTLKEVADMLEKMYDNYVL